METGIMICPKGVIKWAIDNKDNIAILRKGIYIPNNVRISLCCAGWERQVKLNGIIREFEFNGYGDGLYKVFIKI